MVRFALKGILGRKLRTALTGIAIVLGVAMVAGTFMLTDSIDKAFDSIFTDVRQGSNAVISGKSAFDLSEGSGTNSPTLDESLLPEARRLPSVAEAEGSVDGEAQLIGEDGKAIVYGGEPNLGFTVSSGDSPFNPPHARPGRLAEGRRARRRRVGHRRDRRLDLPRASSLEANVLEALQYE